MHRLRCTSVRPSHPLLSANHFGHLLRHGALLSITDFWGLCQKHDHVFLCFHLIWLSSKPLIHNKCPVYTLQVKYEIDRESRLGLCRGRNIERDNIQGINFALMCHEIPLCWKAFRVSTEKSEPPSFVISSSFVSARLVLNSWCLFIIRLCSIGESHYIDCKC